MSPSKADFQVVLGQARELVRDQLELTEKTIMHVAEAAPAGIADRLVSLFESKGKRIRSTLLCLISNCGNVTPDAKRVAQSCASVELLHLASLVHDNIIDGTELRRGKETAHKKWGTQVAVLVGDYVLSQSMRCVIDEQEGDVPVIISDAADKLIVGEIMELDHCGELSLSRATYNEIIDGKTAALIEAAARIGGIMAGFDKPLIDECAKMGAHFGLAFQIIDDLLDYGYGSKNLDKAKFTDLSNGLITLPLLYYFEDCNAEERAEMESLVKRAATEDVAHEILERLNAKKSFDKAKAEAQEHLEQALQIAEKFPKNNFTDEIVAMFASMSDRGN